MRMPLANVHTPRAQSLRGLTQFGVDVIWVVQEPRRFLDGIGTSIRDLQHSYDTGLVLEPYEYPAGLSIDLRRGQLPQPRHRTLANPYCLDPRSSTDGTLRMRRDSLEQCSIGLPELWFGWFRKPLQSPHERVV